MFKYLQNRIKRNLIIRAGGFYVELKEMLYGYNGH